MAEKVQDSKLPTDLTSEIISKTNLYLRRLGSPVSFLQKAPSSPKLTLTFRIRNFLDAAFLSKSIFPSASSSQA